MDDESEFGDSHGSFARPSGVPNSSQQLRQLMAKKEKELQQINELRFRALEDEIKAKENQLVNEKAKFSRLRQDFDYNLRLLEERDDELAKYDKTFSDFRQRMQDRDAEVSELRIAMADLQTKLKHEQSRIVDVESYYQTKLMETKDLIQQARWQAEQTLTQQREDLESQRRKLVTQIREKDSEVDLIRREAGLNYQSAVKQLQEKHLATTKELMDTIEGHEEKLKEQSKSIELLSIDKNAAHARIAELQFALRDMEKQFKASIWELEDLIRTRDVKIRELEHQLMKTEDSKSAIISEFEHKMTDLMSALNSVEQEFSAESQAKESLLHKAASEKDTFLRETTQAFQTKLESISETCERLRKELENEKASRKREGWEAEERYRKRETEHLQELSLEKIAHERTLSEVASLRNEVQNREKDITSLRDKNTSLKKSIEEKRSEIDALKVQLLAQTERETSNKQLNTEHISRLQVELDQRNRDVSKLQESLVALDTHMESSEKQLKELTSQKSELAHLLEKSEEQCRLLQQELERADMELSQWRRNTRPQPIQVSRLQRFADSNPITSGPDVMKSPASVALPDLSPLPSPSNLVPPTPMYTNEREQRQQNDDHQQILSRGDQWHHSQELQRENEELQAQCQRLQTENQRVRMVITDMRQELETLQRMPGTTDERNSMKTLQAELEALRQDSDAKLRELLQLRTENRNLQEQASFIQKALDDAVRDKIELSERCKVAEAHHEALIRENKMLRGKIHEAAKDLVRLTAEKESLLDLNSALRADLNSMTISRSGKEDESGRYSSRLSSVENSLRETQQRNARLRQELEMHVDARGLDQIPTRLDHGNPRALLVLLAFLSFLFSTLFVFEHESHNCFAADDSPRTSITYTIQYVSVISHFSNICRVSVP
eukprot:TRINITY_DN7999_c0_g1_i2.p1 TRINITY_DN7999_c0_g1~~TRINITY_DN7999_c0_g1_i2.p1  ORF type:complete len:902 (-),score=198.94 TRINITY_DN7999_c0_g1_i2:218-2923(-)